MTDSLDNGASAPNDDVTPLNAVRVRKDLKDLGDGTWITPFRAALLKMPANARALIPDASPFWLEESWLFGGSGVENAVLVKNMEQAAVLNAINAQFVAVGIPSVAVWGPDHIAPFLGDLHFLFDEERLVRLLVRVEAAAMAGIAAGREVGMQAAAAHFTNLTTIAPVATSALLALVLAQVVAKKPLLDCDERELQAVHDATGRLLSAVGLASARALRPTDLAGMLPPSPPAAGGDVPGPGQYL